MSGRSRRKLCLCLSLVIEATCGAEVGYTRASTHKTAHEKKTEHAHEAHKSRDAEAGRQENILVTSNVVRSCRA